MDKRTMRKKMGAYTWALLIYYGIMNLSVSFVTEMALVAEGLQAVIRGGHWMDFYTGMEQALESVVYGNAWGYIFASGVAVLLIPLWKGTAFFRGMFETRRDMTRKDFLQLVCVLLSGQVLVQIIAVVVELIVNCFGLSAMEAMQMASAGADTLSMFLYMGLVAPVVEELIFRGLILRGLMPYGKRFAIMASSVLFGVFHGNLIQSPYAFAVGLVLGYTAVEYSITWAMVLHAVNNLVLGDMILRMTAGLPAIAAELVIWAIILVCTAAAICILYKNRHIIAFRRKDDPIDKTVMKAFAWSLPNWILYLVMGFSAVLMLLV